MADRAAAKDLAPVFRRAAPEDAGQLSALALRSKAHWGYDADFMAACAGELTLARDEVVTSRTLVAELNGLLAGFITIVGEPPAGEIGALFVEPARMRSGIGERLLRQALSVAILEGFEMITVDSDPNAESFYVRMGAQRAGSAASGSIAGRMLPRLKFDLDAWSRSAEPAGEG